MVRIPAFCLLLLFLLAHGIQSAAAAEVREWTDSTGKHKMKASFVSLTDGDVTLAQEDGEELVIPLAKLSKADQEFVAEAMKADADNPFKAKAPSPFKSKRKAPPSRTRPKRDMPADDAEVEVPDNSRTRELEVDLSQVEDVPLQAPSETWAVSVPTDITPIAKPKPAKLPKKADFFEHLKGLAVNTTAQRVAVGFLLEKHGETATSRVAICDLATGRCTAPVSAAGNMIPIALHDDGKQLVMRSEEFGSGNLDEMEIWTVAGGVKRLAKWTPYHAEQGGNRDVMWAEFLDAEHLATSSRGGQVVIWKYPELEPEVQFRTAVGAVPGLSPDRKSIAYSDGKVMGIFDVAKRQVIAQQATPSALQWPYMAFSPAGKRLACMAFNTLYVWDVATGKLERTIPCDGIHGHGAIEFPDENFVLVGNRALIELQYSVKLWNYSGQEQVRCRNGWAFFAVTDGDNPGTLAATKIPHPAATELLNSALQDPELFVLSAGTTVKLNCSQIADPAQRAATEAALTKGLQAVQCKVGPEGKIELSAMLEGPKDREVSFFGGGTHKMKEFVSRVRFTYDGKSVWESASSNVPHIVHYGPNETIEMVLRKSEQPNYAFFGQVQLPKMLQKPSQNGQGATLGQSRVTTTGFQ